MLSCNGCARPRRWACGIAPGAAAVVRVAYFARGTIGGHSTRFLQLVEPFAAAGVELRLIEPRPAGTAPPSLEQLGGRANLGEVWPLPAALGQATAALIERLCRERFTAVMVPTTGNPLTAMLPLHLPQSIAVILLAVGTTPSSIWWAAHTQAHADRIIAVSARVAQRLRWARVASRKIVVVHNGIDAEPQPRDRAPAAAAEYLVVAYLGRLIDAEKGVLRLPPIIDRCVGTGARIHLDVYGAGRDEAALRAGLERRRLLDYACLHGAVANTEVASRLRSADCLLMPSRHEAFGFSALEAMAVGCVPVVARLAGSLAMLVEHGRCGFTVRQGNIRGYAASLLRLQRSPDLLARMSTRAIARARELSASRMAEGYLRVIDAAAASPAARAGPVPLRHYRIATSPWQAISAHVPNRLKNGIRLLLE